MDKNECKQTTLLVECENCKQKFQIGEQNAVTHKRKLVVEGEVIYLTYYDCPSCGKRHFVQIDNDKTLQHLNDVTSRFKSLSVKRIKDQQISRKQSARFEKARKHLANSRIELMKKYTGKLVHDNETDSDFELRFSV